MASSEKTPAPAPAPKQYFRGIVKSVLDGGAVVIRGPVRNGPPAERILGLTNIDAPRLARRPPPNSSAPLTEARLFSLSKLGTSGIFLFFQ